MLILVNGRWLSRCVPNDVVSELLLLEGKYTFVAGADFFFFFLLIKRM